MEKEVDVEETVNLGYKLTSLLEENKDLATEANSDMELQELIIYWVASKCISEIWSRGYLFMQFCILKTNTLTLQGKNVLCNDYFDYMDGDALSVSYL